MNAEDLRQLDLASLVSQLKRAVTMAETALSGALVDYENPATELEPLLTIGDFDVYPRGEAHLQLANLSLVYHKEAAQNAAMRAALLASRHVLEHSSSELVHAQSSAQWLLERDRAYMAIQVALGEVGSVAPMARKAVGSTERKRDLQSGE